MVHTRERQCGGQKCGSCLMGKTFACVWGFGKWCCFNDSPVLQGFRALLPFPMLLEVWASIQSFTFPPHKTLWSSISYKPLWTVAWSAWCDLLNVCTLWLLCQEMQSQACTSHGRQFYRDPETTGLPCLHHWQISFKISSSKMVVFGMEKTYKVHLQLQESSFLRKAKVLSGVLKPRSFMQNCISPSLSKT